MSLISLVDIVCLKANKLMFLSKERLAGHYTRKHHNYALCASKLLISKNIEENTVTFRRLSIKIL